MHTRCPNCQTIFRVSQAQLSAARGQVRCGQCQQVFNAYEFITAAPAAKAAPAREQPPQMDWLHHADPEEFEHIDLGSADSPAATPDTIDQTEPVADKPEEGFTFILPEQPDEVSAPAADRPAEEVPFEFNYSSATLQPLEEEEETPAPEENEAEDEIFIEDPYLYTPEPAEDSAELKARGIGHAFEDDREAQTEDKREISALFAEVDRQLHDEEEAPEDDDDAFDSVLGYIEDIEQNGELSQQEPAAAEEPPPALNMEADLDATHLPPVQADIPYRLQSSMQALEQERRSPLISIALGLAVCVLLAGLLLQVGVFRSYQLAQSLPALRPLLTSVCQRLPCVYSGRRDPRQIQLLNRDVRAHPKAQQALLITATLINQAKFAQPYPDIRITLSDLGGAEVAQRRFVPDDYLKADELRLRLMRPGVPVLINLEVLDPGSEAVNFEFTFL